MSSTGNEITVSSAIGITKTSALINRDGMAVTGLQFGMYGSTRVRNAISLAAAATALPLGSVTQPHWAFFANLAALGSQITITGAAAHTGLIQITAASHGFVTGNRVLIWGVLGTTEANGLWTVTNISSSTFDLQSSTFTNTYVSGGIAQLANSLTIRNGSGGADVMELLGGETAGPLPLAPGSTPYAVANVANTVLDYLIVNL